MNPPTFVRRLRDTERLELAKLIRKGGDARVVRRAQMVRLSAMGKTCGNIADLLGFSLPGVHRVIQAFNARGLTALSDKPRSGRPPKATPPYVEALKHAVAKSPKEFGYGFTMGHFQDPKDYNEKKAILDFLKKTRSTRGTTSTSSSSMSVRFISTLP